MAMKKHIELLELKVQELEQTVAHQKELLSMVNSNMNNQKMIMEMIISKLNSMSPPAQPPAQALDTTELTSLAPNATPSSRVSPHNPFATNRKVIV